MVMTEVLLRLLLAVVIGGFIGYEREFKNRPAGFRTHILVCIGAAVISMIQLYSIEETTNLILKYPVLSSALKADIGRIGSQVVSGVGFLGAGTIIHHKGSVKGLTTAASLWVVACIGLAVGLGYYYLSALATGGVFIVLVILKKVESRFFDDLTSVKFRIYYDNRENMLTRLEEYFTSHNYKVNDIEFIGEREEDSGGVVYTLSVPRHFKAESVLYDILKLDNISKVSIQ